MLARDHDLLGMGICFININRNTNLRISSLYYLSTNVNRICCLEFDFLHLIMVLKDMQVMSNSRSHILFRSGDQHNSQANNFSGKRSAMAIYIYFSCSRVEKIIFREI